MISLMVYPQSEKKTNNNRKRKKNSIFKYFTKEKSEICFSPSKYITNQHIDIGCVVNLIKKVSVIS